MDTGGSLVRLRFSRRVRVTTILITGLLLLASGLAWFLHRYDTSPKQVVPLRSFSDQEYPDNPERRSRSYGTYPHRDLHIERLDRTHVRFVLTAGSDRATQIELRDVDLSLMVAAVPRRILSDPGLTTVGLIDREWNRQQVRFRRDAPHVLVHEGGDGFEQRSLSRIDLARNCLNAGLWELLLFTVEDGEERLYDHLWFTFPLGLYKDLFEKVNGLSYWSYWWSLEHWVDPDGTPIRLDLLRTVEWEQPMSADVRWNEPVAAMGEQVLKRRNILTPVAATYRDWYHQPVQLASFIPPGIYSRADPRDTQLHYLAELTGATVRQIAIAGWPHGLLEVELGFRSNQTGEPTRLILGGLNISVLPALSPQQYDQGWRVPMGIGSPSFVESYDMLAANPPM